MKTTIVVFLHTESTHNIDKGHFILLNKLPLRGTVSRLLLKVRYGNARSINFRWNNSTRNPLLTKTDEPFISHEKIKPDQRVKLYYKIRNSSNKHQDTYFAARSIYYRFSKIKTTYSSSVFTCFGARFWY